MQESAQWLSNPATDYPKMPDQHLAESGIFLPEKYPVPTALYITHSRTRYNSLLTGPGFSPSSVSKSILKAG